MPRQILLADDSSTIARMVQITFAHEDYALTAVRSGDEALARARTVKPDIVLVDAGLPGKTGYDVCGELRAAGLRDVPVLILTSNFVPYDEARGQRAGADGFVVKPFDTQGLIDRVAQILTQRASGVRTSPVSVAPAATAAPATQPARTAPLVTPPPAAPTPAPSLIPNRPAVSPRVVTGPTPVIAAPVSPFTASATNAPAVLAAGSVSVPTATARPDSGGHGARPRATLMGLPTVGPDGLPVTVVPPVNPARTTSPQMSVPPAASPVPPVAVAVAAAPAAMRPASVSAPTAPTMSMPAPSLPRAEPVRLDRQAPSDFAQIPATLPGPGPQMPEGSDDGSSPATDDRRATIPTMPASHMAHDQHAAAASHKNGIPDNAPRMPRASLVPNAPSPEDLRRLVHAVTAAAGPRVAQALGAHPEYEAIARLSREVIEQIAWEVVPELAEILIRGELDRLVKERTRS